LLILKIEHLEREIAQYIEQEQVFNDKISDFEKFETEMMEKLEATDEENKQLAEENRILIDKVLKSSIFATFQDTPPQKNQVQSIVH
jgi:hypothetical protein